MATQIILPSNGLITRDAFAGLPTPSHGWAWELRSGRLELTYMPVTFWHWQVVLALLEYWRRRGHQVAGEQYVADSGFIRGGTGRNNYVADGVVFIAGHRPAPVKQPTTYPSFMQLSKRYRIIARNRTRR